MDKTTTAHGATAGLIAAVRKLVRAKGRFHTEQNYAVLVAALDAYDVDALAQPRAEQADDEYEAPRVCVHPLATRPVLYTDTVGGVQTCRDDLWAVTTEELNALTRQAAPEAPTEYVRAGWFVREGIAWINTSSDDPRATILYREAELAPATQQAGAAVACDACKGEARVMVSGTMSKCALCKGTGKHHGPAATTASASLDEQSNVPPPFAAPAQHDAGLPDAIVWEIATHLFGTVQYVSREESFVRIESPADAGKLARAVQAELERRDRAHGSASAKDQK